MHDKDKQELIALCLKLPCSECGKHELEYVEMDKVEQDITIPNVPTIHCKHCGANGYPSFAYDHIKTYKAQISR